MSSARSVAMMLEDLSERSLRLSEALEVLHSGMHRSRAPHYRRAAYGAARDAKGFHYLADMEDAGRTHQDGSLR